MIQFTQFFWYKLLFMLELLVSEFLFTFRLRKRRFFALRFSLCAAACFAAAAFFPTPVRNAYYTIFLFAALFGITIIAHLVCYNDSFVHILFGLIAGYTVQHIAYCLNNCMLLLTGLNYNVFGIYTDEVVASGGLPANIVFGYIFTFAIYYLTYYAAFLWYGNRIRKNQDLRLKNLSLLFVTGLSLLISIVVNSIVVFTVAETYVILLVGFYNVLSCGFILYMQFSMLNTSHLERELQTVSRLLHESHERFEAARENIDLINMKCHDLKHQIRKIGEASFVDESALREIENVVAVYDSTVETGNRVLDTILTEKSLFCQRHDIHLTCMADGARLGFMKDADLYALFGNAVDNAFSAVMKIRDRQKRHIGLTIRKVKEFVSVNVNNYYEGEMVFDPKGLPVTTKGNTDYHGFGLKSMRFITEKYKGTLSVDAGGGVFNLNILFPAVPDTQGGGRASL